MQICRVNALVGFWPVKPQLNPSSHSNLYHFFDCLMPPKLPVYTPERGDAANVLIALMHTNQSEHTALSVPTL